MALWGAKVMCETNCFSVGNMLKSVPYSLSTNWTVSTPIASIPAKSTPLIRYSAWRRGSSRSELLLGRKHAQVCAIFAEHQLDGFHTDRIDPGQVHPADPVQRLAQGFFPALFDRLRLFRVAQFRRCLPAALFPLHLCQLPHNFPLILRDALLDGVVHLQGLPSVNKWSATPEMERIAAWLKERNVESVAMEATGVYWVEAHEGLEGDGLGGALGG